MRDACEAFIDLVPSLFYLPLNILPSAAAPLLLILGQTFLIVLNSQGFALLDRSPSQWGLWDTHKQGPGCLSGPLAWPAVDKSQEWAYQMTN